MIALPTLLALSLFGGSVWTGTTLPVVLTPAPQDTTPPATTSTDNTKPGSPRPNPDVSGKYHVGDGVTAPTLIHSAEPKFSRATRKMNAEDDCVVALTVNTAGLPTDVHVIKSFADAVDQTLREAALSLDEASVKAVEKYRFTPATYQGKPVPVELRVDIHFSVH